MSEQRYVVKLASGAWIATAGNSTSVFKDAHRATRIEAYRIAASWGNHGAVALRLKTGKRAAELAKLRAEVEELGTRCDAHEADTMDAERKLDAMTKERDALAARLVLAEESIRLLRGPVAPARPVEELRDELERIYDSLPSYLPGDKIRSDWAAVAKRARELGAR